MKKEKKKIDRKKAGVAIGTILGTIFVFGLLIGFNIQDIVPTSVETEEMWQKVYIWTPLAEGDPGTGASGFLEIFFINHSTEAATCYDENSSSTLESWCVANMAGKTPYGTADEFDVELASEVSFDIVVRVRFNKTHAWETDKFNGGDCDCQITTSCTSWADGEDDANTSATYHVESRNDTGEDYIWINFVWDADDNNGCITSFRRSCTI